jgi:hypothetical protein
VKSPSHLTNLSGAVAERNLSIKVSNPMNSASSALIRSACFAAAPVFHRNLVTVKGRHFRRPLFAEIGQDELRETKARLAPAAVGDEAHPHEAQDHHRPCRGLRDCSDNPIYLHRTVIVFLPVGNYAVAFFSTA